MKMIIYRNCYINDFYDTATNELLGAGAMYKWNLCKAGNESEAFYVEIPEKFELGEDVTGEQHFYNEQEVPFELCGNMNSVSLVGDEIIDLKILGKA